MNDDLVTTTTGSVAMLLAAICPAFSLAAGVIPPAADVFKFLLQDATDARKKAALDDLLAEVAGLDGYDQAECEKRFIAAIMDCERQGLGDLLYDHHRAIYFGKSRAAWPYVVKLTADHIKNKGGQPDNYSRRMARLLERCEEEDLEVLKVAARCTLGMLSKFPASDGQYSWTDHSTGALNIGPWKETGSVKRQEVKTAGLLHTADIINLVDDARLGFKNGTGVLVLHLNEPFTEPFLRLMASRVGTG